MNEFYNNYASKILKKIFQAYKSGDKKAIEGYALELKELNKTIFLDKQLVK